MGSRGIVGSAGGVEAVVSAIGSPKYCRGSWTLPISTLSDIGLMFETLFLRQGSDTWPRLRWPWANAMIDARYAQSSGSSSWADLD